MRILCVLALVAFALYAGIRSQDASAMSWVFIYGYAAMLALMALLGVDVLLPALAGGAGYAAVAWRLSPETSTGAAGVFACAAWSLLLAGEAITRHWRLARREQLRREEVLAARAKPSREFAKTSTL